MPRKQVIKEKKIYGALHASHHIEREKGEPAIHIELPGPPFALACVNQPDRAEFAPSTCDAPRPVELLFTPAH
jgi:hypothetical protein